ncbi:unnamed protein product, partial [Choristocarpus tenellus]
MSEGGGDRVAVVGQFRPVSNSVFAGPFSRAGHPRRGTTRGLPLKMALESGEARPVSNPSNTNRYHRHYNNPVRDAWEEEQHTPVPHQQPTPTQAPTPPTKLPLRTRAVVPSPQQRREPLPKSRASSVSRPQSDIGTITPLPEVEEDITDLRVSLQSSLDEAQADMA